MSETERFTGRRYDIVAFAYGEKTLYYEEFSDEWGDGEYGGGNWVLVGRGVNAFSLYRGEFGYRCDDCRRDQDPFGQEFDPRFEGFDARRTNVTRKRAIAFVQRSGLHPLFTIPEAVMRRLCEARTLVEVLPARLRRVDRGTAAPGEVIAATAAGVITAVKLEMGWPLVIQDVLDVTNQDLRSRALAAIGYARFVDETAMEVRHRDVNGVLLQVQDLAFVHVRDASTSRPYVLRVPRRMRTVRQAIAWTFGFDREDDYNPIKET